MRVFLASVSGVAAFTSFNSPLAPGNWNLPTETPAFGAELVKTLPDIGVRYHYPHVDPASILASVEDEMAMQSRLSAVSHELAFDRDALMALAGHTSFVKGPEDAIYGAASGVAVEAPQGSPIDSASELMLGLSHAPHPQKKAGVHVAGSCPKDYGVCPQGWSASAGGCEATSYSGPCAARTMNFSAMPLAAKIRFENQCGAPFPCSAGARDYSARCPAGWSNSGGSSCTPPSDYTGSCGAAEFSGYNAAMLAKWEQLCGAYWA
jgi:CPW-WPC domain-containing protein